MVDFVNFQIHFFLIICVALFILQEVIYQNFIDFLKSVSYKAWRIEKEREELHYLLID